jgi:hypothetical protein
MVHRLRCWLADTTGVEQLHVYGTPTVDADGRLRVYCLFCGAASSGVSVVPTIAFARDGQKDGRREDTTLDAAR